MYYYNESSSIVVSKQDLKLTGISTGCENDKLDLIWSDRCSAMQNYFVSS